MDADTVTERIFQLFQYYGDSGYLGEPVSQTGHMVQCAMLAEQEGCSEEVVLGALLHDIGHLIGLHEGLSTMQTGTTVLGAANHDEIGAQYLRDQGLPEGVWTLVKGHVDAKRYLVFKDEEYRKKLSDASKMTLVHQGGPMESEEAALFEASPHFHAILRMRYWDEHAKDPTRKIEPLSKYKEMCKRCLAKNNVS